MRAPSETRECFRLIPLSAPFIRLLASCCEEWEWVEMEELNWVGLGRWL